ncbi:hypothetical protein [Georgenia yuyongxinii]|uniref:Lipoprotein LpqN n=1 Tax=Georgenia yuyongxinii TaxID=2589797 RepID=A0A552WVC6_9MICO|nr:hypothetical protein [Georgenia yuyongxinii]TRW46734.1 hypothetical protein FJ693_04385 [Georgenia yuyongxinii]
MAASTFVTRRRRAIALLAAGTAGVALLGACSGGGSPSSQSSTAASSSAASTSGTPGASSSGSATAKESRPPGDIPDNQVYVPYTPDGAIYTVNVPEGWQRTDLPGGATFTDKLSSVTIQQEDAATAPTVASVRAQGRPIAAAPTTGYKDGKVEQVSVPAGSAVRATYSAQGPADPVTGKSATDDVVVYTFFHGGKEVELVLAGPHGADSASPWKIVSESFWWTA